MDGPISGVDPLSIHPANQQTVEQIEVILIEVLRRAKTENPYLERAFAHPAFGSVPSGCLEQLDSISTVHPDEKVLTAMRVNHGIGEQGFLILTTHFLRYIKAGRLITVLKKNDFWSLDSRVTLEGSPILGVICTASGDNFQAQGRSRKNAKEFFELYELAALSLQWTETQRRDLHDAAAASALNQGPVKTCPRCAEDVKLAALVCRFCGHEFEAP